MVCDSSLPVGPTALPTLSKSRSVCGRTEISHMNTQIIIIIIIVIITILIIIIIILFIIIIIIIRERESAS